MPRSYCGGGAERHRQVTRSSASPVEQNWGCPCRCLQYGGLLALLVALLEPRPPARGVATRSSTSAPTEVHLDLCPGVRVRAVHEAEERLGIQKQHPIS